MLTETEAFALLEQHCRSLGDVYCSPRWISVDYRHQTEWLDVARFHVDLVACAGTVQTKSLQEGGFTWSNAQEIGARLRLALGVAQAVSRCRGFEPATNQRFWRRVAGVLWPENEYHRAMDPLALSPTAFDHVGIAWQARLIADEAFWLGFLQGTPDCDAALCSVLETLGPHFSMSSRLPPLRISLSRCCTRVMSPWNDGELDKEKIFTESAVTPEALKMILRAAFDPLTEPWTSAPTQLGLVVEYRVGDNAYLTRETLDLLAQVSTHSPTHPLQLTIDRLTIQLAPPIPPRRPESDPRSCQAFVTRLQELGLVLRTTLLLEGNIIRYPRAHSVMLLGCSQSDYRLVGAALSAVAWTTQPITALRCSDVCDLSQPLDQQLRLAWFLYAVHRRLCRANARSAPLAISLLSTGTMIDEHDKT